MSMPICPAAAVMTRPRRGFPKSGANLDRSMKLMGTRVPYTGNREIFGEEEPTEHLYKVIKGWVRSYKILGDGRRQIISFHKSGDLFGLTLAEKHHFSAEAINDTIILVVKRSGIMGLVARTTPTLAVRCGP
jgi:CRP/FNR family transcriptional regulator, nitrogen fixation regulation protein